MSSTSREVSAPTAESAAGARLHGADASASTKVANHAVTCAWKPKPPAAAAPPAEALVPMTLHLSFSAEPLHAGVATTRERRRGDIQRSCWQFAGGDGKRPPRGDRLCWWA
jgi:hypothetical protein